ncbi:hypothetical protein [Desulfopila sp. IMCC35008]|uniref:hypothetical protein n=1 Tax=Desulfopila sp. IMCC35008 TaxID=2653858 RepID=UPI0013D33C8D|nr:hypothetical protein [Desulfopila sp. IMCC35008]
MCIPLKKAFPIVLVGMMFFLIGCSPTVKLQRLRPAEVDMSSMRRLALTDFDYYHGSIDSVEDFVIGIIANSAGLNYGDDIHARKAASYATNEIFNALRDTGYFDIVDMTSMGARKEAFPKGAYRKS